MAKISEIYHESKTQYDGYMESIENCKAQLEKCKEDSEILDKQIALSKSVQFENQQKANGEIVYMCKLEQEIKNAEEQIAREKLREKALKK